MSVKTKWVVEAHPNVCRWDGESLQFRPDLTYLEIDQSLTQQKTKTFLLNSHLQFLILRDHIIKSE